MSVEWVKLGNVAEVIRGASPRPKGDPRYFGGDIPWIMIADVTKQPGKYLSKTREGVTPEGAKKSRLLKAGTLILSNSGTVCVPKILAVDGCIHDGFVAFPDLPNTINKDYLYHYFNFIRPRIIQENKQGITQVNLNTNIVKDIDFPLRPLDVQQKIVDEIETQLSRLDETVTALKRIQANLKRYKAAVLKAAVEGKLTEQWRRRGGLRPPSDPADGGTTGRMQCAPTETGADLIKRILAERRAKWEAEELAKMKAKGTKPKDDSWKKKYKEPAGPDTANLPELPERWVWVELELVSDVVDPHPSHRTPAVVENGIPYVGMGDITSDGKIDLQNARKISPSFLEEHRERYSLKQGDMIFGKIGTIGKPVKLSPPFIYALSANVILVQPKNNAACPGFCFSFLASPFMDSIIKKESKATTQSAFGIQKVRIIPFPLPPLTEQQAIVEEIDRRLSVTEELETTIETSLKRAERLRQSILQRAFAGGVA